MNPVWQYIFGGVGALLTVYIRSEESIPAFRAIFDYEEMETELSEVIRDIDEDINFRKQYTEKYAKKELEDQQFDRLFKEINSRIEASIARRTYLEGHVYRAQIGHRIFGFLVYIVLGGVFAGLLSDYIEIVGVDSTLVDAIKPLVIGATWTTYLSTLGFRRQEQVKNESEKKVASISREITPKIEQMGELVANLQNLKDPAKSISQVEMNNVLRNFQDLKKQTQDKLAEFKTSGIKHRK